jgi:hypothetical protein
MDPSDAKTKATRPGPSRGRPGRRKAGTTDPGEPAGRSTTGTQTSGPPAVAAVTRAVRVLREVVGDLSPGNDPLRIVVLPVDGILPVLDEVLRLLEELPARVE